ncbi:MAG: hypothetical protein EA402_02625 [Planctomycetota bacterium]|nr:MAG: hypothetical protein EA402_02625 [Planctomycetota bacterium]
MNSPTLAVARLSFANGLRQPMTWLVLALGLALLGLSYLFGMFSFEASSRMRLLLTGGVASGVVLGCFLGVFTVAQSVHDELTSRTALTLFAKPMPRASFLLGKVLGAVALVAVVVSVLLLVHLLALYLAQQVGFEWDERHRRYHQASDVGYLPWSSVLVAHILGFAGNVALICLAALLALKLSLAGSVLLTFAAFVLAHLWAVGGGSSALLLPALQLGNVDDALHFSDVDITLTYFILSIGHAILYGAACLVIGILVLERQDIP